jgi:hypothetical protein
VSKDKNEWRARKKAPAKGEGGDKMSIAFGRLLDRQVGGFVALENPAGIDAGQAKRFMTEISSSHLGFLRRTSGRQRSRT